MPCIPLPGGGFACTGRARRTRCETPGCTNWSDALCDWQLHRIEDSKRVYLVDAKGERRTCSAGMCQRHRHPVGPGKDLCGPHYRLATEQGLVSA